MEEKMDFLELFNQVAKIVRPSHAVDITVRSLDEPLKNTGLDSMDALMIGIFLADAYGVPEEIAKEMKPTTAGEFQDFLEKHKTKTPESIDQAIKGVSW
jgi:acyl carrier protein